jgi:hypothetical protein
MVMANAKKTVAGTDKPEGSAAPSQQKSTDAPPPEKRQPVWSHRENDVSVSAWKREYNGLLFYSFSFERSYKDAGGQWKYTRSFGEDDLGKLVACIQAASDYMLKPRNRDAVPA